MAAINKTSSHAIPVESATRPNRPEIVGKICKENQRSTTVEGIGNNENMKVNRPKRTKTHPNADLGCREKRSKKPTLRLTANWTMGYDLDLKLKRFRH